MREHAFRMTKNLDDTSDRNELMTWNIKNMTWSIRKRKKKNKEIEHVSYLMITRMI